ncbi:hypothetical protein LTR62_004741 [Meristemomyces frigidus]|uniref:Uncharacterized protein n=1 Tax=Meristemomyces frigidus TaxID=1508187 RepID=A0AAN7YFU9_9PEZI|nr:hypothetical protein LTR62_004741 [Meristemomyces frigidus]
MARLRSAPTATASPPRQNTRPALREKTNTTRGAKTGPIYEDDSNTDGLVKDVAPRRGRPKKSVHVPEDLVMSGALTQQISDPPALSTDPLTKSDAPPPTTVKANRRPPRMTRKPIQNEAKSKVLEGLKKRMQEQARREAGEDVEVPAAAETTSMATLPSSDILSVPSGVARSSTLVQHDLLQYNPPASLAPSGKISPGKGDRTSLALQSTFVGRSRPTPAIDTSVLKNFRRRPRQPSMLAVVQGRTASARPSNVTAAVIATMEDPSVYDFDDESGEGENETDFAPDAEGTPLNASKVKRKSAGSSVARKSASKLVHARTSTGNRKRKSDEADLSLGSLSVLRAKRQRPDAAAQIVDGSVLPVQLESSGRRGRLSFNSARDDTPPALDMTDEIQVPNSSQSSPPPAVPGHATEAQRYFDDELVVPSTEEQRPLKPRDALEQEDELDDDLLAGAPNGTMAEPASSSPAREAISSSQLRLREELADPVTQVSPQPERRKPANEKPKHMSTAALQSLLPKRRQPPKPRHRKSEYDFDSQSDIDTEPDDDNALGDEGHRNHRSRRATKVTPAKTRRKATAAQTKSAKPRKSKTAPQSRNSAAAQKPPKTYGRAAAAPTTSDKENEDGFESAEEDVDTSASLPEKSAVHKAAAQSSELEEARRKFAEVDRWDLEFDESWGEGEHRSSSQGWR